MMMDRRTLLKSALGGATTLLFFPRLAASRPQSPGITRLNDALSLVNGVGTNVLALSTTEGVVLVDSGAPQFSPSLTKALSAIAGSRRVQKVFNTHFHLENTGSNEAFGQAGAQILAHERTREWMATPYWIPSEDRYQKPRPKAAQPTETFYTSGSLKAGTEQIDYGYLI
ncbi:MAG TPA: MBL fold metallo-hydrolase, partial [Terriglobia bacterium]|nr:MBL fold metallo-hydrolase [Terriglobia bacterium]